LLTNVTIRGTCVETRDEYVDLFLRFGRVRDLVMAIFDFLLLCVGRFESWIDGRRLQLFQFQTHFGVCLIVRIELSDYFVDFTLRFLLFNVAICVLVMTIAVCQSRDLIFFLLQNLF
jgi:hypothetical protein